MGALRVVLSLWQDALIDTIKRSKMHFVHCFLPVAEGWPGEPRAASSRRVSSSSELDLPPGDPCEAGLLQLDVSLLRAQLRGSRLLDAMRMYRQGEAPSPLHQALVLFPELADATLLPSSLGAGWRSFSFLVPAQPVAFSPVYFGTPLFLFSLSHSSPTPVCLCVCACA